jgi:hypothetical protein
MEEEHDSDVISLIPEDPLESPPTFPSCERGRDETDGQDGDGDGELLARELRSQRDDVMDQDKELEVLHGSIERLSALGERIHSTIVENDVLFGSLEEDYENVKHTSKLVEKKGKRVKSSHKKGMFSHNKDQMEMKTAN